MLSKFDDYPIHQTPEPVAHPATSDKDFYDRYWFNGYSQSGDVFFGIGTARYPHMGVQDCGVSVVVDGRQYAFHASARATEEPTDMRVGPFDLQIEEPMRVCRVVVEPNDTGFSCDLRFEGRTGCVEEPRHHLGRGMRKVMDTTRFAQLGHWSGWIDIEGRRIDFTRADTWGTKDRSWGTRPIAGGDQRGAPADGGLGGLFFLWAPLNFPDIGFHYQLFDDPKGRPLFQVGAQLPVYESPDALPGVEDPAVDDMRALTHELEFVPGTRMVASARLTMTSVNDDAVHTVTLTPQFAFAMKGIGYNHPTWSHGVWHGGLKLELEQWELADVDTAAYENQHVQHVCRARYEAPDGVHEGIGVLEQIIVGPYRPYGLEGFLDPPPS